MAHITIVGTSHIAPESLERVKRVITEKKPDFVAVELDKKRLHALMQESPQGASWRDIKRVGFKGWLFAVIGSWATRKLGSQVGVSPGSEMVEAVKTAKSAGSKIALIDQDIEITLRRFSNAITWKEKWRFFVDIVKGIFFRKTVKFDLAKVPSRKIIKELLDEVKVRYPNVYRVLVDERNHFMAERLAWLAFNHPDSLIIAVVGAGHEEELVVLVKKYLYRLTNVDGKKDGS